MANRKQTAAAEQTEQTEQTEKFEQTEAKSGTRIVAPADYDEAPDDLIGFWDPEIQDTIHVTILEAKVFDSNKYDKTKPVTLLTCRLESPAVLASKDEHKNDIQVNGNKGDIIGIWGKPGMRKKVFNRAGQDIYISPAGTKDVGKGEPMKLFSVKFDKKKKGRQIPLTEDTRDKSKNADIWWSKSVVESDEDLPF